MSGPAFVVMPVQTGGAEKSEQNPEECKIQILGNIKKVIEYHTDIFNPTAHKDSLYKYMNAGAVIFGTIFLTEFISRQFASDTFLLRLRPEYKKVPEPTLNATLKDIHDFVQYGVVQLQKMIYGEDLGKTFVAFLSFITVFWLMKVASPFSLAVLGLTSIFIAPLVNSSHGRAVAQDTVARGKELANTAAEKGKTLAEDGKSRAAELSSKAHETSQDVQQQVGNLTERGKSTVNSISGQATAEDSGKLRDMGVDAISKAPSTAKPSFDDAKQDKPRTYASILDEGSDDYRYDTGGAANNISQSSDNTFNTPRRMAAHNNTINKSHCPDTALRNREKIVSFR
ncbi:unnamed protein product [Fusarium equiseti]|uniref:Reticulon domain-containing protein n=1 Tax=Fusarium equiseti TaxID=61235 RepID=A0A8J2JBD5_FUSEQ|nr:unnamed protein product [Fusarium equiseti]